MRCVSVTVSSTVAFGANIATLCCSVTVELYVSVTKKVSVLVSVTVLIGPILNVLGRLIFERGSILLLDEDNGMAVEVEGMITVDVKGIIIVEANGMVTEDLGVTSVSDNVNVCVSVDDEVKLFPVMIVGSMREVSTIRLVTKLGRQKKPRRERNSNQRMFRV